MGLGGFDTSCGFMVLPDPERTDWFCHGAWHDWSYFGGLRPVAGRSCHWASSRIRRQSENDARLQRSRRLLHPNSSGSPPTPKRKRLPHPSFFFFFTFLPAQTADQVTGVQHASGTPPPPHPATLTPTFSSLPALCASPKRTSVMLLGSL